MQNVHVFLRSNMPNFKKKLGHTKSNSSFVARETKKHNIIFPSSLSAEKFACFQKR